MNISKSIKSKFWVNHEDKDLIEQRIVNLRSSYDMISDDIKPERIKKTMEELFEKRDWNSTEYLEQLMAQYYPEEELELKLDEAIDSLKMNNVPGRPKLTKAQISNASLQMKRTLLAQMLRLLHWNYEVDRQKTQFINVIGIRLSIAFIILFFLIFLPEMFPDVAKMINVVHDEKSEFIYNAVVTGMFGASFSMLLNLEGRSRKKTMSQLKFDVHSVTLLFRIFVGAGAGLILFYLLESHTLSGSILPNVDDIQGIVGFQISTENRAKLFVWSFIAGFSEKLIPSILEKTADKAESSLESKTTTNMPPVTTPTPAPTSTGNENR